MRKKSLTIKISTLASSYLALLVTCYFLVNGFTMSGILQTAAFSIVIIFSLIPLRAAHIDNLSFMWVLSVLPFFWSIKTWSAADIRDFVAYIAFIVFIIFGTRKLSSFDAAIRIIYFMAFFHLAFVIINVVFRNAFVGFMGSALDANALPTFYKYVEGGYNSGLGYIPGDTSGYLVDGMLILFCTKYMEDRKRFVISAGLLLLGILFCAKKSHLLCLVITLLLLWLMTASGSKKVKRVIIIVISVLAVITIGYKLLPMFSNIPMLNRISVSLDKLISGSDYTSGRDNLNTYAIQMFQSHPIWGAGWKAFNQFTYDKWGNVNYVNNVYLQVLTETGITGAVLFFTPMAVTFVRTFKALKIAKVQRELDGEDRYFNAVILSMGIQLFFLLYGIYEIPFYDYTFLFIYAIGVALVNSAIKEQNSSRYRLGYEGGL